MDKHRYPASMAAARPSPLPEEQTAHPDHSRTTGYGQGIVCAHSHGQGIYVWMPSPTPVEQGFKASELQAQYLFIHVITSHTHQAFDPDLGEIRLAHRLQDFGLIHAEFCLFLGYMDL